MTGQASSDAVSAHIEGDIAGQIAVGNYILQVGTVHGGVVNIAAPGQQPQPRLRASPILLRPRPLRGWLDRAIELKVSLDAIHVGLPVQVYGEPGVGKTALLRRLAHDQEVTSFPHGVIYLSSRQPLADLLQSLFDAFYETSVPCKQTDAEIHLALQDRKALLLLDDVALERAELEVLLDAIPNSSVVVATIERTLWGEVQSVQLSGLPVDDAIVLVERELGRSLQQKERADAVALATAVHGHPMRLLQAAARTREENNSLADVLEALRSSVEKQPITRDMLRRMDEKERRVLAALIAIGAAGLAAPALAAVADAQDVSIVTERLMRRGLVETQANRYLAASVVAPVAHEAFDIRGLTDRAIDFFSDWAWQHRGDNAVLVQESAALVAAQTRAAERARWQDVLRIGWPAGTALLLSKQWAAWSALLKRNLEAARALDDKPAEALALHEAGTRALCLGDAPAAQQLLTDALGIRESIGDTAGAAVTRHNLTICVPPPVQESTRPERQGNVEAPRDAGIDSQVAAVTSAGKGVSFVAKVALALLGVAGVGVLWSWLARETTQSHDEQGSSASTEQRVLAQPTIILQPADVQFEPQTIRTAAEPRTVVLTNTGSATITMSKTEVSGGNAADFLIRDDSCRAPLAGGDSCRITVSFTPSAEGTRTALLSFTSGVAGVRSSVKLSGVGVAVDRSRAALPARVDFGSRTVKGEAASREVVITNPSAPVLRIARADVTGDYAGEFSIASDTCSGAVLQQRAHCSIHIRFIPSSLGVRAGRLTVTDNAEDSPHLVALGGEGIAAPAPDPRLAPGVVEFQPQEIRHSSAPQTVRLTNAGNGPLVIGRVHAEGVYASDFRIGRNTCASATLPPSESCTIEVGFSPMGAGPRTGKLTVEHNAGNAAHTVELRGTALPPPAPVARVHPMELEFGSLRQGTSSDSRPVSIENGGGGALVIKRVDVTGAHARDFRVENRCTGVTLDRGRACSIEVRFAPQGTGVRRAELLLADDSGSAPRHVSLSGLSEIPGRLDVRPQQVDFGQQQLTTSSGSALVTVTNTGTASLALERVDITGPHASDFNVLRACVSTTLARGDVCRVALRFTPKAPGARTATLLLASADGQQQQVLLRGFAQGIGRIGIAPTALDFGVAGMRKDVRTVSEPRPVTVRNTGTGPLALRAVTLGGPHSRDFEVVDRNACGSATLAVGESCVLEVRFTPVMPATRTATLAISDATGASYSISLSGEGRAIPMSPTHLPGTVIIPHPDILTGKGPTVRVVPEQVNFGVQPVFTPNIDRAKAHMPSAGASGPITVSNIGQTQAVVKSVTVQGANKDDFTIPDRASCGLLEPNQECTITVIFRPLGAGPRRAELVVTHNGPRSPAQISLLGEGRGQEGAPSRDAGKKPGGIAATILKAVPEILKGIPGSTSPTAPSGAPGPTTPTGAAGPGAPLGAGGCTDLVAAAIEFTTVRRLTQYEADIRVTATLMNLGPSDLTPSSRGLVILYENNRAVQRQTLSQLASKNSATVSYERRWNSSSPSEGEFPPQYRVEVTATTDCDPRNNQTSRNGVEINQMIRAGSPSTIDRSRPVREVVPRTR